MGPPVAIFYFTYRKVQGAIVVILMGSCAWVSHFVYLKFFYVMGKAQSGELSCMETGLVYFERFSK